MSFPPDLVAQVDQHAAHVSEVLDRLIETQREFVAVQGAENSFYVCSLAAILTDQLCHGHCADLLALAARRLAELTTESDNRIP